MGLLDPAYVDAIKGFEGYRDTPYWDYKQYTSGYGTKAASPDEKIDPATADQRLNTALDAAGQAVDAVNPNLPPGARAALVSLTYNAGPGWTQSGLGDLVRNGDLQGAQAKLLEYNKAGGQVNPGLVSRRQQEASWFDSPPTSRAPLSIAPPSSQASAAPAPQQRQGRSAPFSFAPSAPEPQVDLNALAQVPQLAPLAPLLMPQRINLAQVFSRRG